MKLTVFYVSLQNIHLMARATLSIGMFTSTL
jgi:hypothetical protein